METKIASYQEHGIRLQLINIMPDDINLTYTEMKNHGHYQIRKNRKVLCNMKSESPARQKFNTLIQQELLQTKINNEK